MVRNPPIVVTGLFREVNHHLVALLRALSNDDWNRPTVSSERTVKDIASHLLDGSFRRLALQRDGYSVPDMPPLRTYDEVMGYINRVNREWTIATRRLSPRIVTELLEQTGPEVEELLAALDPFAPAVYGVAWAGEMRSLNWLDVAREYTEKWHHTQQIFDAVGRPSTIAGRRLFHPCLDTFMWALPYTYRDTSAPDGTTVEVVVRGAAGGEWAIRREAGAWVRSAGGSATVTVCMDQDSAWRLFTKRMSRETALARFPDIEIRGDSALGHVAVGMLSVMA